MKIAYFHCFAGAAGDMILGALLDAGLPWDDLLADLALLPCEGYRLERQEVVKQGIRGTKLNVLVDHDEGHRSLGDIRHLLENSGLPPDIREKSLLIFTRMAKAEAAVHGTSAEEIFFHEVGALDAIVDVVGAVAGLKRLAIEVVYASPINVGGGWARCAHGLIPAPGPATMELLKGVPVYSRGAEQELLTPTGAAILTSCSSGFGDMPLHVMMAQGYGAGKRDLSIPNLLRVTIGEMWDGMSVETASGAFDEYGQAPALIMEANIDDMNPEFFDHIMTGLLEAGAMDVFLQPIQMKKNRPAVTLSVLLRPQDAEIIRRQIFSETTTLGVRVYPVTKYMLSREIMTVSTVLGEARVKIARRRDAVCSLAPEYEDCRRLAKDCQVPIQEVYEIVKEEARNMLRDP